MWYNVGVNLLYINKKGEETMKKFRKILVALVFGFMAFVGLTGCGKGDEIVGAQIVSGSIATTVARGGSVDTSRMKAQIRYKEADAKVVNANELEIVQAPDTSVVGETTMKLKYGDYEFTVKIRVVASEADVNSISLLESQLLKDFAANTKHNPNATELEKRDEFYDITQPHLVGDDNAFSFRINAAGRDSANRYVGDIEKVRTKISIAKEIGVNQYVALTDEEMARYIDTNGIDTENTTINFSQAAADEEMVFQVVVEAENKDLTAEENATKFTAVLHIIDGYNVYNATDLSIYDNANRHGVWTDKKAATGMAGKTTNAVILQDNITVTKDDVPAGYFWNAQTQGNEANYKLRMNKLKELEETDKDLLDGTLINDSGVGLYRRIVANGDVFRFEGNYFKLDLSQFPKAISENNIGTASDKVVSKKKSKAITSYISTFWNTTDTEEAPNAHLDISNPNTSVSYNNIRFYGNGSLNNEVENSGSIILMKNGYVNFNAYNTIQHNYYIGYFLEYGVREGMKNDQGQLIDQNHANTGTYIIDTCKGYNSYQDLFYGYGAEKVIIKNSEFIRAGGPAIVAAFHGNTEFEPNKRANWEMSSNFYIVESTVESEVVGTEAWFDNYGATSTVQQFVLLEDLFSGAAGIPASGKTIFTEGSTDAVKKLNILGIVYNANMKGISPAYSEGSIRVFDTQAEYDNFMAHGEAADSTYGLDNDKMYNGQFSQLFAGQSIYLESEGVGGYINQNVESNWDTTYFGMFQANALAGIVGQICTMSPELAQQLVAEGVVLPGADFMAKSLTEQKTILSGFVTGLKTFYTEAVNGALQAAAAAEQYAAAGQYELAQQYAAMAQSAKEMATNIGTAIMGVYAYGSRLDGYQMGAIKRAIFNIDPMTVLSDAANVTDGVGLDDFDPAKVADALIAQIASFENVSFSAGSHLNIYLPFGIGVTIGLTDVTPAQA